MTEMALESHDNDVHLHVWVVPGASKTELTGRHNGMVRLRVSSPAEAGKANREATKFLSGKIEAEVILLRGMTSRHKVFEVAGANVGVVARKLGLDI